MAERIIRGEILVLCAACSLIADTWTVRTPPRVGNDPEWNVHYDSDHFSVWCSDQ